MKRYGLVAIGNGLYCRINPGETLMQWYRRKQLECSHPHRDPRGMCYDCGHVTAAKEQK